MKPFVALGSPASALLTRPSGLRPLGAVMGVSVVQTTMNQGLSGLDGTELKSRGEAVGLAVANARDRMIERAVALEAGLVLGVRMEMREREETASAPAWIEVRCFGTAFADETATSKPTITNLDAAEWIALQAAAYQTVGLAIGYAYYSQIPGYRTTNARGTKGAWGYAPYEHPDFTRAVYAVRQLAMSRMEDDARAAGGEGIVGIDLDPSIRIGESLCAGLFALGTVVRRDRWFRASVPEPAIVIPIGS